MLWVPLLYIRYHLRCLSKKVSGTFEKIILNHEEGTWKILQNLGTEVGWKKFSNADKIFLKPDMKNPWHLIGDTP